MARQPVEALRSEQTMSVWEPFTKSPRTANCGRYSISMEPTENFPYAPYLSVKMVASMELLRTEVRPTPTTQPNMGMEQFSKSRQTDFSQRYTLSTEQTGPDLTLV